MAYVRCCSVCSDVRSCSLFLSKIDRFITTNAAAGIMNADRVR
jgi:hypothetical protein